MSPIAASGEAQLFAAGWIARNIEVGPFSCDDAPVYAGALAAFLKDAADAGLSQADLERGIGNVPAFLTKAYSDAVVAWRLEQRLGDEARANLGR